MSLRALRRKSANALFIGFCVIATLIAVGVLALILWTLLSKGLNGISLDTFTKETPSGLSNAIVGSLMMCGLAMGVALVIGILAGTWLSEFGGETRYGHTIRFLNDVLLAAPSILIGLFVSELLVARGLGHFSGIAGALALALIAIPVVLRTTEDILALQSQALREAGSALGTPSWMVVRNIIWRAAGGGLLTGGLLAFARISGETAPLLFTSLGNQFLRTDLTQPMASMPKVIYDNALTASDALQQLAWNGALLVTFAVLVVNIVGRLIIAAKANRS
jgi:phosphate transport system permease protein